jgi:NAD(P)H dehydrogenase (quinone)
LEFTNNRKENAMYTIIGITGQVGGAAARALLKDGKKVCAIVRDKAKASAWETAGVELTVASLDDAAALESAFRGAEGVFAMVPPCFAPAAGYPETRGIVAVLHRALQAAKPARAVYLSSVGAHQSEGLGLITQSHILEEEMKSLPIPNAFVRAAWFMENSQWDVAPARERGEIDAFLAPLDRPFPMVATEDIGQLIANTLQQEWSGNRHLELEGPGRYSQLDAAETFARLLNHPVVAKPVPRDKWQTLFEDQGTSPDRTAPRIEMLDGFNSGWIDFEGGPGTEHVRGTRTQEEVFQDLLRKAGYRA